MRGFVYILSNPAMPGIYKIGYTTRSPEERAGELNTTGVPKPFSVEYAIEIDDCEIIEAKIHKKLANFRYGKEFFQCDLEYCLNMLKSFTYSNYIKKDDSTDFDGSEEGWKNKFLLEEKKKGVIRSFPNNYAEQYYSNCLKGHIDGKGFTLEERREEAKRIKRLLDEHEIFKKKREQEEHELKKKREQEERERIDFEDRQRAEQERLIKIRQKEINRKIFYIFVICCVSLILLFYITHILKR